MKKFVKIALALCVIMALFTCLVACGEDADTSGHIHSYRKAYEFHGDYHWQTCIYCDEVKNYEPHTYGEWEVLEEATVEKEGLRKHTCDRCGYSQTEVIEKVDPSKRDINTYIITWLNYDGTLLRTDRDVVSDTMPSYKGEDPVREGDDTYSYVFIGWDPAIAKCKEDTTYTAKFEKVKNIFATNIELSDTELTMYIGDTYQLSAEVYPHDTFDKEVTWETDRNELLSVDENGLLEAKAKGSIIVTVRSKASNGIFAKCYVTVIPKPIELFTYEKIDGKEEYSLVAYSGSESEVIIPATYKDLPVTDIATGAFRGNVYVEKVVIPSTIVTMGSGIFKRCESLRSVTLPVLLKDIPKEMFAYCTALQKISIPETVETIGDSAFEGTSVLSTVELPDGLKSIGTGAFKEAGVSTLTIPSSVESIGKNAFCYASNLRVVALPANSNYTKIEESTFEYCRGLTRIEIPENVIEIDKLAFNHCYSLSYMTVIGGLEYIGEQAFYDCSVLESVELGNVALLVEEWAFARCPMLKSAKYDARLDNILIEPNNDSLSECAYKVDEQPATCLESGYQHTYYFNGTNARTASYEPLGHTGGTATCAKLAECERCGAKYGEIDPSNHDYDDVVVDPTCLTGGYTIRTCKDCGHMEQAKPTLPLGHTLSATVKAPTCSEGGYTTYKCLNCDYEITRDRQDPLGHILDKKGVCSRCGQWSALRCNQFGGETETDEGYILFGEYPQTRVTDNVLLSTLNRNIPLLPTADNYYNWTPYSYSNFVSGSSVVSGEVHMWYFDYTLTIPAATEADYDTYERYRAVYFDEYRALSPSNPESYQELNGYKSGTVYWFKYERLIWQVLSEMNGEAHVLCTSIIDFQPFFDQFTLNGGNYYNVGDEIPDGTMANDYEYSYIRSWLLNDFYTTAFSQLQRERLKSEKISVDSVSGKKALADKVTLLSKAQYEQYGIGSDYNNFKVASDYALCQQGFDGADKYDNQWYLYNPENTGSEDNFATDGKKVLSSANFYGIVSNPIEYSSMGIVPECWVTLVTTHVCKFDQEVVNQKALKANATCLSPAIYYKSCTCGKCSKYESDTFEYGLKSGHKIQDGKCVNCGQNAAVRCDVYGRINENGNYILFGSYPKSSVTEQPLLANITAAAGDVPVEIAALTYDRKGWTPYDYYLKAFGEDGIHSEEFAWYKDVEYDGQKYRAVYYNRYRQIDLYGSATFGNHPTKQVFVFKFEPIIWRIVRSNDTTFTVVSYEPVDVLQYTLENTKATTYDGKTEYYPADWDYSYLRTYLNDTFYNEAFNELEAENIIQTNLRTETANRGTVITKDNVYIPDKAEAEYISGLSSPIKGDEMTTYTYMLGGLDAVNAPLRSVASGSNGMNINVASESSMAISDMVPSKVNLAVHPEMVIHVCSFNKQIQDERYLYCEKDCTHALTYYKTCECGAMCLDEKYLFTVGDPLGHTPDENGKCTKCGEWSYIRCDADKTPNKKGEYILFGEYPSELVRNLKVEEKLNALPCMSHLPSKNNLNGWNAFENLRFNSDTNTGQMAYYDYYMSLPNETVKYRAIYFSDYPDKVEHSDGTINGFAKNKVYWFKYEPILWRIYDLKDGKANIVCVSSIDSINLDKAVAHDWAYERTYLKQFIDIVFSEMTFNNIQKEMITEITQVKAGYECAEDLTNYSSYARIKGLKVESGYSSTYVLTPNILTDSYLPMLFDKNGSNLPEGIENDPTIGLMPMISVVLDKNHICDYSRENGLHVAEDRYLKSVATCTQLARYYVSCTCGSCSETETFSYGDYAPHDPSQEIIKDSALKSPANCTSPAIYYRSCVNCDTVCRSPENEFTYGDPVHYLGENINESYVASEATCTEPKKYYLSCKCGIACNTNETFSVGEPLGHNFVYDSCSRCGLKSYARVNGAGNDDNNGDYVYFGSYPTSRVTDTGLVNSLNSLLNADILTRYSQVEYVENTGEGFYNTNFIFDYKSAMVLDFSFTKEPNGTETLIGSNLISFGSSNDYRTGLMYHRTFFSDTPVIATNDLDRYKAQRVVIGQDGSAYNGSIEFDGGGIISGKPAESGIIGWRDTCSLMIFAKNNGHNQAKEFAKGRIYKLVLKGDGSTWELKPYIDHATGDICLADLSQNIFLYPMHGEDLVAGPYVKTAKTYTGPAVGCIGSYGETIATFSWYADFEYNGYMYRALYNATPKPEDVYLFFEDEDFIPLPSGYVYNRVYWFKFEPVKWAIIEETDDTLTIVSCRVLDSYLLNEHNLYYYVIVDGQRIRRDPPTYEFSRVRQYIIENAYDALVSGSDGSIVIPGTWGDLLTVPNVNQARAYIDKGYPLQNVTEYAKVAGPESGFKSLYFTSTQADMYDNYAVNRNGHIDNNVQCDTNANNVVFCITLQKR